MATYPTAIEIQEILSSNQAISSDDMLSCKNRQSLKNTMAGTLKWPIKYSLSEALKLNNFEVFVSFLKFIIQMSVFSKPMLIKRYGLTNSIISSVLTLVFVICSNYNLILSM